jgi:fibronectin type 3 domain-containing protein
MNNKRKLLYFCVFLTTMLLNGCSWFDDTSNSDSNNGGNGDSSVSVTVNPSSVTLAKGTTQQFSATVANSYSQSVTWSVEGNLSTATIISRDGLLSVGGDENARSLTVKATYSSYSGTASGAATVTIATEAEIPSNLKITRPGKTGIPLSWGAVNNAANYKVYRSTNGKDYSYLGDTSSASYSDMAVSPGSSYYYAVSAVVNGLETGRSAVAFGFAEEYFALPVFAGSRLVPSTAGQKHYYRFPVTSGESYTITWENGSSQNADWYIRCAAWQNDGTAIFTNATNGYTSSKVFTAATAGFITVEVSNVHGSARLDYMAYCLRTNGEADTGVAALPPASVTGIKVSNPSVSSISLAWNSLPDAVKYNIYRSTTKTATPGLLGSSDSPAFTDNNIGANTPSYYYTIAPVNADGKEGVWVQGAFAFAALHYPLPNYSSSQLMNIATGSKHYYRFEVTARQDITITWENGSSQNADWYIRCAAWQNDGTEIFTNATNGYTSPKVFTAATAGFITVEVSNVHGSASLNYQIYR